MYDAISRDYDRFVNWEARLAAELPFLERQLAAVGAQRVLDVACGTGKHAIALAERGYMVTGADFSEGMIQVARQNAAGVGLDVRFEVAGFGSLHERFGSSYDALLCLGNSLPHVLSFEEVVDVLRDMVSCLRPGGLLLIQNRNFDQVLAERERWMEPQAHREEGREWVFLRFYDFDPDGNLTFNMVTLKREDDGPWRQHVAATRLHPLREQALSQALGMAGLGALTRWGSMDGAVFDAARSPNLVVAAQATG
ncbi:MAG: class I SAM-dependent methyltransferase [Anaerolineales bacterium]|nr:class I SAM-dependent methyltransferase [Anaerolineales bacterium]